MKANMAGASLKVSNALFGVSVLLVLVSLAVWDGRDREVLGAEALPPSGLVVSVGTVEPRVTVPVTLRLNNRGPRTLRVLGALSVCAIRGCIQAVDLPVPIPARREGEVKLEIRAYGTGDFELKTELYTDSQEAKAYPVRVRGRVNPSAPRRGPERGTPCNPASPANATTLPVT